MDEGYVKSLIQHTQEVVDTAGYADRRMMLGASMESMDLQGTVSLMSEELQNAFDEIKKNEKELQQIFLIAEKLFERNTVLQSSNVDQKETIEQ